MRTTFFFKFYIDNMIFTELFSDKKYCHVLVVLEENIISRKVKAIICSIFGGIIAENNIPSHTNDRTLYVYIKYKRKHADLHIRNIWYLFFRPGFTKKRYINRE